MLTEANSRKIRNTSIVVLPLPPPRGQLSPRLGRATRTAAHPCNPCAGGVTARPAVAAAIATPLLWPLRGPTRRPAPHRPRRAGDLSTLGACRTAPTVTTAQVARAWTQARQTCAMSYLQAEGGMRSSVWAELPAY